MESASPESGGRVILLHGASSSGKTSIARELLRQLPAPYLHFSFDRLRDDGAMPIERFRSGEFAWADVRQGLFVGYEQAIAALAGAGNNVVADYIIETKEWLDRVQGVLSGLNVFFVGVHCPLEELERREATRGDRPLGDARRDFFMVHQHCTYDFEVDSTLPPEQNAAKIVAALRLHGGGPGRD